MQSLLWILNVNFLEQKRTNAEEYNSQSFTIVIQSSVFCCLLFTHIFFLLFVVTDETKQKTQPQRGKTIYFTCFQLIWLLSIIHSATMIFYQKLAIPIAYFSQRQNKTHTHAHNNMQREKEKNRESFTRIEDHFFLQLSALAPLSLRRLLAHGVSVSGNMYSPFNMLYCSICREYMLALM